MVVEWNHGYDPDKILRLTEEFAAKRIVAAGPKEVAAWADSLTRSEAQAEGASVEQRGA
ncbi:hypothetical protein D3C78_1989570 [compost metagenome]